ncbi:MAG TPA: (Fe-S)-binding protein [Candidatus Aquilonibacter sp.]|nr:(Fe-S)-binding protein [Candidatus Aquilonibacter sp.]
MLEAVYNSCVRCGLCLPSCPTYLETLTETSGPRGRIGLIKAVDEGAIDLLSAGFVEQMTQCLDCRACEAACPSGVQYGVLVETMRARIETAAGPTRTPAARTLRRFLIDGLFAKLPLMRAAARLVRFAQRTRLDALSALVGLQREARLAPRVADRFFVAADQRYDVDDAAGTAFLHVGCVMQVAFGGVHEASIRMLNRAGLRVVVPRAQGCCGAIAVHAGEPDAARALARVNIAAFEASAADVYVVNAAGCGSTLKEYAQLFEDDPAWKQRASAFAARVRDITEVLDAMEFRGTPRTLDVTVTYQEPCHLVHAQRVAAAPRRLLQRIPGLRLIEMNESSVCCGSAGIYNLTEPEMARRLRDRKTRNILATGAGIVATANPGCEIQVTSGLREGHSDVRVAHIVELLDEAYS